MGGGSVGGGGLVGGGSVGGGGSVEVGWGLGVLVGLGVFVSLGVLIGLGVLVSLGVVVGPGVGVSVGSNVGVPVDGGGCVGVGTGVPVGAKVFVGTGVAVGIGPGVFVGTCVAVLGGVGVLAEVVVGIGVFDPCPGGGFVALGMNTEVTVPVVVGASVPAELFAARARLVGVTDGTAERVGGTFGVFVGVKNCSANASRVMARSRGVGVAVRRGVRTMSGRVSNLSPPNTNGK